MASILDFARQGSSVGVELERKPSIWERLHIDLPLLCGLVMVLSFGLMVLYSATDSNEAEVRRQFFYILLGFCVMFGVAQIDLRHAEHHAETKQDVEELTTDFGFVTVGGAVEHHQTEAQHHHQATQQGKIDVQAFPDAGLAFKLNTYAAALSSKVQNRGHLTLRQGVSEEMREGAGAGMNSGFSCPFSNR